VRQKFISAVHHRARTMLAALRLTTALFATALPVRFYRLSISRCFCLGEDMNGYVERTKNAELKRTVGFETFESDD